MEIKNTKYIPTDIIYLFFFRLFLENFYLFKKYIISMTSHVD